MTDREELLDMIKDLAVLYGDFTLASGRKASYYVDMRRVTLEGRAAPLIGRVMLDTVKDVDFDAVGGLTMGADPVAFAIMHAAVAAGRPVDGFVVRKAPKDHGTTKRVEGPDVAGRRVLVVEDTSTTGGSPLNAVQAVRDAGGEVVAVAVVVDRSAGAAEAIAEIGLPYYHAYGLDDLGLA